MALTAARTELNVALVGEDETIRMIEDAKKRVAELEAKTRSLTGATQGQTQAAQAQTQAAKAATDAVRAQESATGNLNSTLGRMGGAISGPLEGIGKLKESISKGIEIFGFLGAGITGVITAYNFLNEKFNDAKKESDRVTAALKAQAEQAKETTDKTNELADAQQKAVSGKRSAQENLISEQLKLAKLEKDSAAMAALEKQLVHTQQMNNVAELTEEVQKKTAEIQAAYNQNAEAHARVAQAQVDLAKVSAKAAAVDLQITEKKLALESAALEESEAGALRALQIGGELQRLNAQSNQLRAEALSLTNNILVPEKARAQASYDTWTALRNQRSVLNDMLGVASKVAGFLKDALGGAGGADGALNMDVLDESGAAKKPRGGGGGGKSKAQRDKEEIEKADKARWEAIKRGIDWVADKFAKQRAKTLQGISDEILTQQKATKDAIEKELASLPTGATAKAYEPLRRELEKQLAEVNKVVEKHVTELGVKADVESPWFEREYVNKVADAYQSEVDGITKVNQALSGLNDTRAQAAVEAEKLNKQQAEAAAEAAKIAAAMERASIADVITSTTSALQGLSEIQAPALEAITQSVAGLTTQFGKFKEGQTSLASAIVGSAGAVAGAVANKVLGVREEAGVRALFETAMGIATAFGNPLESAGHFAAAAAFGAVALGGFKSTPSGGSGGGSKAPAKTDAKSRDSMMGGGGGQVTNVYNLQTGIVDGQSTAQAFRRAEMQARNTGMASAGGW